MVLNEIIELVGNDILEIFGKSGTGKTSFALTLVNEALNSKKNVLYIDTEKNLKKEPQCDYVYIASMQSLYNYIVGEKKYAEKKYDIIVLDSLGATVLGEFATMDMKERGSALLKAEAITYTLKVYSHTNNAFVLIINQPESEFGKPSNYRLEPFGDKHIYFVKEVWESKRLDTSNQYATVCNISAFRSRIFGRDTLLYQLTISGSPDKVNCSIVNKWRPNTKQ